MSLGTGACASNHYCSFKHPLLSLVPCVNPVGVLVGAEWVYTHYYGTFALIIKVNGFLLQSI